MNKILILSDSKWSKTLAGYDLCEDLIKQYILVNSLIGENGVIVEDSVTAY